MMLSCAFHVVNRSGGNAKLREDSGDNRTVSSITTVHLLYSVPVTDASVYYCILGNFQGENCHKLVKNTNFVEKTYTDCSLVPHHKVNCDMHIT